MSIAGDYLFVSLLVCLAALPLVGLWCLTIVVVDQVTAMWRKHVVQREYRAMRQAMDREGRKRELDAIIAWGANRWDGRR